MASITCRNGETFPNTHTHHSVAAVRQCQGAPLKWEMTRADAKAVPDFNKDPRNVYLNTKSVPVQLATFDGSKLGVTGAEAMANAERLTRELGEFKPKSLPAGTVAPEGWSSLRVDPELEAKIPDGRYGIEQDGVVKFYRVRKVTEGKWVGRTFVDRQAGDESFPVRFGTERAKILAAIAADVKAAAIRYGKELGQCSQCGRTLTNPDSIKAGIGPVCLSRLGG